MEKEGRVHGYGVAERIAERTEGSWRPGPGAIYPSLQKLVTRGWARGRAEGRRREYEITAAGRRCLSQIRQRQSASGPARLDLSALWSEVAGSDDLDEFLVSRLRRTLDLLGRRLESPKLSPRAAADLREDLMGELSRSLEKVRRGPARRSIPRRKVAG
jgi:DNA-binding PadR family transcriptional regulator